MISSYSETQAECGFEGYFRLDWGSSGRVFESRRPDHTSTLPCEYPLTQYDNRGFLR